MLRRFAILLALLCGCANFNSYIAVDPIGSTAKWYTDVKRDDACVVAVMERNGETKFACRNCDTNSIFRVASLSKLMLEPVILSLVDDGLVDLDASVASYLKNQLPPEYDTLTLRELYENRSGLPREFIDPWCLGDVFTAFHCGFALIDIYQDFGDREKFVVKLSHPTVRGDVRRRGRRYSNMGFALLMMCITDHLNLSIDELISERLVKRYGLVDTAFDPTDEMLARYTRACSGALPWLIKRGDSVPDHQLGEVARDTGGLRTSAADMLKVFSTFWPRIDALIAAMPENPEYDHHGETVVGLFKAKRLGNGRLVFFRQGMIYGGASFVGFDPVDRRIVVILRNATSWPSREGFELLEHLAHELE